MEFQDYYTRLDVEKNASAADIKKQYRRLARKYHPDVSKETDAEEKFKQVKEAYEVLKDPEKRKVYDQMGQEPQGSQFHPSDDFNYSKHQHNPNHAHQSHYDGADFSDFFENLFGARGANFRQQQQPNQKGQDVHSDITITINEAYNGCKKTVSLQEPRKKTSGEVTYNNRSLNIKIPVGVTNGQRIRLKQQGGAGIGGGAKGDLYITIHIAQNNTYSTDKKNILLKLPITPWEAALGATIKCPTLGGLVKLKIPANTKSATKMKIKNRGLGKDNQGDQIITLTIETPLPTNTAQEELYKKMADTFDFNPRSAMIAK